MSGAAETPKSNDSEYQAWLNYKKLQPSKVNRAQFDGDVAANSSGLSVDTGFEERSYNINLKNKPETMTERDYIRETLVPQLVRYSGLPADAIAQELDSNKYATSGELRARVGADGKLPIDIEKSFFDAVRKRSEKNNEEKQKLRAGALSHIASGEDLSEKHIEDLASKGVYLRDISQVELDEARAEGAQVRQSLESAINKYKADPNTRDIADVLANRDAGRISETDASEEIRLRGEEAQRITEELKNNTTTAFDSDSNRKFAVSSRPLTQSEIEPARAKRMDKLLAEHGSLKRALEVRKEDEEINRLYENEKRQGFHPFGRLTETTKTAARYLSKAVNVALDTGAIAVDALSAGGASGGQDALKAIGIDSGKARKLLMDASKNWRDKVESDLVLKQNRALKDDFISNEVAEGIAQLSVQLILAPLTGGYSLAYPILEAATGQYNEADKAGAGKASRLLAAAVGGLAGVPDVLLKAKYLRFLSKTGESVFVNKYANAIFQKLSAKFGETEARELTKVAVKSFLKNGAIGFSGETVQEYGEDVVNAVVAKLTYKPDTDLQEVIQPDSKSLRGYAAAGIAGLFGATVETTTAKMSQTELEKLHSDLPSLLEENRISQPMFDAIATQIKTEAAKRDISLPNIVGKPKSLAVQVGAATKKLIADLKEAESKAEKVPMPDVTPTIGSTVEAAVRVKGGKTEIKTGTVEKVNEKAGKDDSLIVNFDDGTKQIVPAKKAVVQGLSFAKADSENLPEQGNESAQVTSEIVPEQKTDIAQAENEEVAHLPKEAAEPKKQIEKIYAGKNTHLREILSATNSFDDAYRENESIEKEIAELKRKKASASKSEKKEIEAQIREREVEIGLITERVQKAQAQFADGLTDKLTEIAKKKGFEVSEDDRDRLAEYALPYLTEGRYMEHAYGKKSVQELSSELVDKYFAENAPQKTNVGKSIAENAKDIPQDNLPGKARNLPASAKEPYEMTQQEFLSDKPPYKHFGTSLKNKPYKQQIIEKNTKSLEDLYKKGHRRQVEKALETGKTVPPEVLADYPDLAAKYNRAIPDKTSPLAENNNSQLSDNKANNAAGAKDAITDKNDSLADISEPDTRTEIKVGETTFAKGNDGWNTLDLGNRQVIEKKLPNASLMIRANNDRIVLDIAEAKEHFNKMPYGKTERTFPITESKEFTTIEAAKDYADDWVKQNSIVENTRSETDTRTEKEKKRDARIQRIADSTKPRGSSASTAKHSLSQFIRLGSGIRRPNQ